MQTWQLGFSFNSLVGCQKKRKKKPYLVLLCTWCFHKIIIISTRQGIFLRTPEWRQKCDKANTVRCYAENLGGSTGVSVHLLCKIETFHNRRWWKKSPETTHAMFSTGSKESRKEGLWGLRAIVGKSPAA